MKKRFLTILSEVCVAVIAVSTVACADQTIVYKQGYNHHNHHNPYRPAKPYKPVKTVVKTHCGQHGCVYDRKQIVNKKGKVFVNELKCKNGLCHNTQKVIKKKHHRDAVVTKKHCDIFGNHCKVVKIKH